MLNYFFYYFLLDTLVDILHPSSKLCINNNPQVLFILVLHHFINCFLLVGWIFNSKSMLLLHFIIVIGTIIYWGINDHLCDLTVYVNKLCGWDEKQSFNDLLNIIGIKKIKSWNKFWHYLVIAFAACISLYKIVYYK